MPFIALTRQFANGQRLRENPCNPLRDSSGPLLREYRVQKIADTRNLDLQPQWKVYSGQKREKMPSFSSSSGKTRLLFVIAIPNGQRTLTSLATSIVIDGLWGTQSSCSASVCHLWPWPSWSGNGLGCSSTVTLHKRWQRALDHTPWETFRLGYRWWGPSSEEEIDPLLVRAMSYSKCHHRLILLSSYSLSN